MANQPIHQYFHPGKNKQIPASNRNSVAVVIVHWNCHEHLHRCLLALSLQTKPADRIIVIDNSSDKVPDISGEFPNVELVVLPENIGFAAANNLALNMTEDCRLLATVNPDVRIDPQWLEILLSTAEEHPECASFSSRLLSTRESNRIDGVGDAYHVSGLAWRSGHGMPANTTGRQDREIFSACAAAALYRRSALLEVSGFDESYFCYCEDVDLGFRLQLAGYRSLYVSGAVAQHVGSVTTGGQNSDFAVYHGHRNMVWTYWKNMPWQLFWLYLPQHLLVNLISLLWYSMCGQLSVIFRAKKDALLGLRPILHKRLNQQKRTKTVLLRLNRVMTKGWLTPYKRRIQTMQLSIESRRKKTNESTMLHEQHESIQVLHD